MKKRSSCKWGRKPDPKSTTFTCVLRVLQLLELQIKLLWIHGAAAFVYRTSSLISEILRQSLLISAEKTEPKLTLCSVFGDLNRRTHLLLMGFSVLLFSYSFKHKDSLEEKGKKIYLPGRISLKDSITV